MVVGSSRGTLELLGRLGTLDPGFVDRVSDVRSRADGIVLELDSLDVVMGPNAGSGTLRASQAVADDLESRGRSAAQFDARFAGLIVVQPRSGS